MVIGPEQISQALPPDKSSTYRKESPGKMNDQPSNQPQKAECYEQSGKKQASLDKAFGLADSKKPGKHQHAKKNKIPAKISNIYTPME